MVSGYNIIERKKITMGWVEVRPVNAVGLVSNMYKLVRKFWRIVAHQEKG